MRIKINSNRFSRDRSFGHKYSLFFSVLNVVKRHWLLEASIGTMDLENEAYKTVIILFSATLVTLTCLPILAMTLFKQLNTRLHPCFPIIEYEVINEEHYRKKNRGALNIGAITQING